MSSSTRKDGPNILITGTPGTGKSTLASTVAEQLNMKHIEVAAVVKENDFNLEYDEARDCYVLDEDKLLDEMETMLENGNCVVDYHSCELFPERWFDAVIILRTDNTKLFDRLKARGYSEAKVKENVQCEIFNMLGEEARESYAVDIVRELESNSPDDMDNNLELISNWASNNRAR